MHRTHLEQYLRYLDARNHISNTLQLLQAPIDGFNFVPNCYAVVHVDRLHQTDRGIFEYVIDLLLKVYCFGAVASSQSG